MPISYKGANAVNGPQPISMDRFGLWTGTFTKTVKTEQAYAFMPLPKSNHPTYTWLQLEKARMQHKGPWTDIVMEFAGIPKNDTEPVYEFIGELSQEPIETHPDFDKILEAAGLTLADVQSSGDNKVFTGFPDSVKESDNKFVQALYGVESYLLAGGTWRMTYCTRREPRADTKRYGKIDTPAGNPPSFDDRNWLYYRFNYEERGKTYRVVKEWKLGGRGGVNELVYDQT